MASKTYSVNKQLLQQMRIEDLRVYRDKLSRVANQRLRSMEKSLNINTKKFLSPWSFMTTKNKVRFHTGLQKSLKRNELEIQIKELEFFLNRPTSTIQGFREKKIQARAEALRIGGYVGKKADLFSEFMELEIYKKIVMLYSSDFVQQQFNKIANDVQDVEGIKKAFEKWLEDGHKGPVKNSLNKIRNDKGNESHFTKIPDKKVKNKSKSWKKRKKGRRK